MPSTLFFFGCFYFWVFGARVLGAVTVAGTSFSERRVQKALPHNKWTICQLKRAKARKDVGAAHPSSPHLTARCGYRLLWPPQPLLGANPWPAIKLFLQQFLELNLSSAFLLLTARGHFNFWSRKFSQEIIIIWCVLPPGGGMTGWLDGNLKLLAFAFLLTYGRETTKDHNLSNY